jgi:hypothetical protein
MITRKYLYVVISIIGMLAAPCGALADHGGDHDGDVDGANFISWQRSFGVSPAESLEIVYDCGNVMAAMVHTSTIKVTNAGGDIIGEIALQNSGDCEDMRRAGRSRGFGFVTMGSSEDGVLLINGERFGALTQNPMTGRYLLGLTMVGSHPPVAGQGVCGGITITVVAPDGGSQLNWEVGQGNYRLLAIDGCNPSSAH